MTTRFSSLRSLFVVVVAPLATVGGTAACEGRAVVDDLGYEDGEELPGGTTTNTLLLGNNAFSRPARNASDDSDLSFFTGNSFFNQNWVQSPASTASRDGLGPLFNARSCAACHFRDGRGAPPLKDGDDFVGLLFRLSVPDGAGGTTNEPTYGGQLQPIAINDVLPEGTPVMTVSERVFRFDDGETITLREPHYTFTDLNYGPMHADVMVSPRVAPQMIGLGLLEAIPAERLESLADPDDVDGDGISGVVQRSHDVQTGDVAIGRFGWKGEEPTVLQQSAGAFVNDIGITSELFPADICTEAQQQCLVASGIDGDVEIAGELLKKVAVYSAILAPPVRPDAKTDDVIAGKRLFHQLGCVACHVPSHTTSTHPTLPELSDQTIWPYTDLLLHDMGDDLADGRPVGLADGRSWRTPPLWGIGRFPEVNGHQRLLHDGRADGVAEAIVWHGGEAQAARDAFAALSASERALVVTFVESL